MDRKFDLFLKKCFPGVVILTFLLIVTPQAFGYVLSGSQILERVVKKLGKAKQLEITQKLVLYDDKLDGGSVELDEKVNYLFPELFRSEIISVDTKKIHLASFDKALMVLDGEIVSEFESGFDHYKDLLVFKDRMILQKRIQMLGLDTQKTRLERYNGRIVYIIGQKESYGDFYPQLFVDKKTFLPIMWQLRGTILLGENTDPLEIVYHEWKKYKRIMLPGKIEFYRNHVLVREIRVEKVNLKSRINESLFDFEVLKDQCLAAKEAKKAKVKTEIPEEKSDTQKTIEGLDKIIENDQLAF